MVTVIAMSSIIIHRWNSWQRFLMENLGIRWVLAKRPHHSQQFLQIWIWDNWNHWEIWDNWDNWNHWDTTDTFQAIATFETTEQTSVTVASITHILFSSKNAVKIGRTHFGRFSDFAPMTNVESATATQLSSCSVKGRPGRPSKIWQCDEDEDDKCENCNADPVTKLLSQIICVTNVTDDAGKHENLPIFIPHDVYWSRNAQKPPKKAEKHPKMAENGKNAPKTQKNYLSLGCNGPILCCKKKYFWTAPTI